MRRLRPDPIRSLHTLAAPVWRETSMSRARSAWLPAGVGALAVFALATEAVAQVSPASVDACVTAGHDARDDRLPARVLGGGVSLHVSITRLWSVGLEIDLPKERVGEQMTTSNPAAGVTVIAVSRKSFRAPTVDLMLLRHLASGSRVDPAVAVGLGIESRTISFSGSVKTIDSSGTETQSSGSQSDVYNWLHVTLGVDVAVAITSHLAIVPQARFFWTPPLGDGCCQGPQSRARLALRWRF